MKPVNFFDEILNQKPDDITQEFALFEKLYNTFITPINKEDIFELYLISLEARKYGFEKVLEIVNKISVDRSIKGAEKMLARCYAVTDDKQKSLLRRLCMIMLRNC